MLTADATRAQLPLHAARLRAISLRELFAQDPERPRRLGLEAAGLYLDSAKQKIDEPALLALETHLQACGFERWREALFGGEAVNGSEGRAALHMALRAGAGAGYQVQGQPVMAAVQAVRERMRAFAQAVIEGRLTGLSGLAFRDVVNIGIGGSDLGPRMICEALPAGPGSPRVHFVANVDGAQLHRVLQGLDPATTLLVITSKTFTTQETMANAGNARAWLVAALGEAAVARHCVAVSTNPAEVARFGIPAERLFEFWDWVGGRYSSWSAVGLAALLHLGGEGFAALLGGAERLDQHFRHSPLRHNLPVRMALLSYWNHNLLGAASQVIAPYAQRLERFVGWLQQLEMESNGKRVTREGQPLAEPTTPALWGDVGTNSQHAFFQMLHQGTAVHPVDFILVREADHPYADQQRLLLVNALAQSAALMRGKTAEEVRRELSARGLAGERLEAAIPHRVFPGDRPSSVLLLPRLDAAHLGALMALYEHRTFVLSVLWGINPFDQWGVELGKQLAQSLLAVDGDGTRSGLDASTLDLLARLSSPGDAPAPP